MNPPFRFDGSSVDFVDFAPGEPNDVGDTGEDAVEMDFRQRLTRFGEVRFAALKPWGSFAHLHHFFRPISVFANLCHPPVAVLTHARFRFCRFLFAQHEVR